MSTRKSRARANSTGGFPSGYSSRLGTFIKKIYFISDVELQSSVLLEYEESAGNDQTSEVNENEIDGIRRSGRKRTPSKKIAQIQAILNKAKRTPSKEQQSRAQESDAADGVDDSFAMDESDLHDRPATLFDDDRDVEGNKMFSFRTPKKRHGMALLAANTPKTPSADMKALTLNSPRTPKSRKPQQNMAKTPHGDRNKLKRALEKRKQKLEDSDDEDEESDATDDEDPDFDRNQHHESTASSSNNSSEESSTESDSSNSNVAMNQSKRTKSSRKSVAAVNKTLEISTPAKRSARLRGRSQLQEQEFIPNSDNYFSTIANKKVRKIIHRPFLSIVRLYFSCIFLQNKTSDNTLDKLKSSRLQYDDLFSILNSLELSHEHRTKTAEMIQELEQHFDKWMIEVSKGYNILIYGLGSKQMLLHKFCELHMAERPVVIVNGFFPSMTVKEILETIKTKVLNISTNTRNEHELVDVIASAVNSSPDTHLFLVVNNIDGPMMRKTKDQHILSRLAKAQNIHLIASIDHINAPLMWDQTCMDNYNFVWYDCTTMLPYTNETAFENSVFLQNSGELGLAAMSNVFQSLTTNARGIYMILANAQLRNQKDANYSGEFQRRKTFSPHDFIRIKTNYLFCRHGIQGFVS